MRAQEITFLKLVQGDKQFQVPLYQRTYSWRREQLQRLWEDIGELVDQHLAGDPTAPHSSAPWCWHPDRSRRAACRDGWWWTDNSA